MTWRYFLRGFAGLAGVMLLGFSPCLLGMVAWQTNHVRTYGQDVYEAAGEVRTRHPAVGKSSPALDVAYVARDGSAQTTRVIVRRDEFGRISVGDPFPVYVSAVAPHIAWAQREGKPSARKMIPFAIVGGAMVFFGVLLARRGYRDASRRARVLRSGQPRQGEITWVDQRPIPKSTRRHQHRVSYAWEAGGRRYEGKTPYVTRELGDTLAVGQPITVYVNPEVPSEGEVDVFKLRKGS